MDKYQRGEVSFPCIEFTKEGTYNFKIREMTESGDGWETDSTEYPVTVIITNDDGELKATVEYPGGYPEFTNIFTPAEICVPLECKKITIGAPLKEGQFEFGVYDKDNKLVCKAKNKAPKDED